MIFFQHIIKVQLFVIVMLAVTLSSCFKKQDASKQVVIKVNNTSMTAKEFTQKLAKQLSQYDAIIAKDPKTISREKENILEDFIVQTITNDWARANNIFVRKKLLDEKIQYYRGLYPDDLSFRRSLSDENVSFNEWKEKLRKTLTHELVSLELVKRIEKPSNKELKDYYKLNKSSFYRPEEVKIQQIVVETKNDALRIEKSLNSRKNMTSLARKFSISPEGKSGGHLGWVQMGSFEIFDQAFKMKVGQKSHVLKSAFGYHIIKVLGKRKGKQLSFDEVKDKVKKKILAKREQVIYSSWLEEQIRKTKVLKNDNVLAKLVVKTRGEE